MGTFKGNWSMTTQEQINRVVKQMKSYASDVNVNIHSELIYLQNPNGYVVDALESRNTRGLELTYFIKNIGYDFREVSKLYAEYKKLKRNISNGYD